MMNKNDVVAVIMGGPSAEREISLVTGAAIAGALVVKLSILLLYCHYLYFQ